VQLVLLAVSFACLLQFGLSLQNAQAWVRRLPLALLIAWGLTVVGLFGVYQDDPGLWRNTGDALARYGLAFPAGLVAAVNLRQAALQRMAGLNAPHILRFLRLAGVSLFLYAFFSGLIVPPVSFFPGNLLNNQIFVDLFSMPPLVFRSAIGLILAFGMIRALEIFDIETARRIEAMEQQQILVGERERIARELHDGALQTVYTAGLLVESAARQAEPGSPAAERLGAAVEALNHAIQDLRRNLTELQTDRPSQAVTAALRDLLQEEQFGSLIPIELSLDLPERQELSPARMDHLLLIVGEALTNAIRHAQARSVFIHAGLIDHKIVVRIVDNGIGLPDAIPRGFGLRNMRDRARLLGGDLQIHSEPGKGATVTLQFPVVED
jgi:signal transduction histidine kinase